MSKRGEEVMDKLMGQKMMMYCVKCRQKGEMRAQEVTMKTGKAAWKAKCPVCGTGCFKINNTIAEPATIFTDIKLQ